MGILTDDFVATVRAQTGEERKLLAQVGRSMRIVRSDAKFRASLADAWKDFNNPKLFRAGLDVIAFFTGPQSANEISGVRPMLDLAHHSASAEEYLSKMETKYFCPQESRGYLQVFVDVIREVSGSKPSDEKLWQFLKGFYLYPFDFDLSGGHDEGLIVDSIAAVMRADATLDARAIWLELVSQAQEWNQSGGTFTHSDVHKRHRRAVRPAVVDSLAKTQALKDYQGNWKQPIVIVPLRAEIAPAIGGQTDEDFEDYQGEAWPSSGRPESRKNRGVVSTTLDEAILSEKRLIVVGPLGSGKTCIARSLCQTLNSHAESFAIWIPLQTVQSDGVPALIKRLFGDADCHWEDLERIFSAHDTWIFFDGIDECPREFRAAAISWIKSIARSHPRISIVMLVRDSHCDPDLAAQLPQSWSKARLAQFTPADRLAYLKHSLAYDDDQVAGLVDKLDKLPGAEYLYLNPFFLHVLVQNLRPQDGEHFDSEAVNLRRVEMLRRYVQIVIAREGGKLTRSRLRKETIDLLISEFSRIAATVNSVNTGTFEAESISQRVPEIDVGVLLPRLSFLEADNSGYRFSHTAFRDFFAALHLKSDSTILANLDDLSYSDLAGAVSFLFELYIGDSQSTLGAIARQRLWSLDPVLCALAIDRNDEFLKRDRFIDETAWTEDPWSRGLVLCAMGEAVDSESEEIANTRACSVPQYLEERLSDRGLWYVASQSSFTRTRASRVEQLLSERTEPWGLLAVYAARGNPSWAERMFPADDRLKRCALGVAPLSSAAEFHTLFAGAANASASSDTKHLAAHLCVHASQAEWYGNYERKLVLRALLPIEQQLSYREIHRLCLRKALPKFPGRLNYYKRDYNDGRRFLELLMNRTNLIPEAMHFFDESEVRYLFNRAYWARLCNEAGPFAAKESVKLGLIKPEEVSAQQRRAWAEKASPEEAASLVRCGILAVAEIPSAKLKRWKTTAGIKSALRLVSCRVLTESDFLPSLKSRWLARADEHQTLMLLIHKVVSWADLDAGQRGRVVAALSTRQLWILAKERLIDRRSLEGSARIAEIETAAARDAQSAALLYAVGLWATHQFTQEALEDLAAGKDKDLKVYCIAEALVLPADLQSAEAALCFAAIKSVADDDPNPKIEVAKELNRVSFTFAVAVEPIQTLPIICGTHPFWGIHDIDIRRVAHLSWPLTRGSLVIAQMRYDRRSGRVFPFDDALGYAPGRIATQELSRTDRDVRWLGHLPDFDSIRLRELISDPSLAEVFQAAEIKALEDDGANLLEFPSKKNQHVEKERRDRVNSALDQRWLSLKILSFDKFSHWGEASHPVFGGKEGSWAVFFVRIVFGTREPEPEDILFARVRLEGSGKCRIDQPAALVCKTTPDR